LIVNQPWDHSSGSVISELFPDQLKVSSFEYDDFTTTTAYDINIMHVPGDEMGNAQFNQRSSARSGPAYPTRGAPW
jgi:hypothetical protein